MSDQSPLNPDALEAMSRQIDPDWWQIIDNYPGDVATPRYRKTALDKAERYARAYLAAALPEVNSEETIREAAVASRHALWDGDFYGFSSESDAQDYGFEEGAKWAQERLARALCKPSEDH